MPVEKLGLDQIYTTTHEVGRETLTLRRSWRDEMSVHLQVRKPRRTNFVVELDGVGRHVSDTTSLGRDEV